MDSLHITTKERMLNTLERFHIYKETVIDNQINNKHTVKPNIMFNVVTRYNPDRGHSTQAWPSSHPSVTFSTPQWLDAPHTASKQVSTFFNVNLIQHIPHYYFNQHLHITVFSVQIPSTSHGDSSLASTSLYLPTTLIQMGATNSLGPLTRTNWIIARYTRVN
jgi:hypothetical protein